MRPPEVERRPLERSAVTTSGKTSPTSYRAGRTLETQIARDAIFWIRWLDDPRHTHWWLRALLERERARDEGRRS